jgi:hypothetical protein
MSRSVSKSCFYPLDNPCHAGSYETAKFFLEHVKHPLRVVVPSILYEHVYNPGKNYAFQ